MNNVIISKFSTTATAAPTLDINNINVIEFLKQKISSRYDFGSDEIVKNGVYKLMGWKYDFKHYLKKFLVKQHGEWREYFALNKTLLRKYIYGRITTIIELKEC